MASSSERVGQPPVRPTIYDVATLAGVSKSLVSLVLRDAPHVSEARRRAVEEAIAELGYRPSKAAATLASHRGRTVGVLIDDFRNPWFVELLAGLRTPLDPHGYTVSLTDLQLEAGAGRNPVEGFLAMHVDGLIIAAEPAPALLEDLSIPVVVAGARKLGGFLGRAGTDTVAGDDAAGGELATRHLLGLGHRSIAHLSGHGGPAEQRRTGFRRAMHAAGLDALVWGTDGGTTEHDGYAAMSTLMTAHPGVTAVFAANDVMAAGAIAALRERGLEVPRDISVVGYDDSPLAAYRLLSLTSINGNSRQVGIQAALALQSRLEDPALAPRRVLLEPTLVVRASSAPPPG